MEISFDNGNNQVIFKIFTGIKVIGGISNKHREPGFGIFIKRILPRGRAAEDGSDKFNSFWGFFAGI